MRKTRHKIFGSALIGALLSSPQLLAADLLDVFLTQSPDNRRHTDRLCSDFHMLRPTLGDVRYTFSYEGTLDPDKCRAMMAREDPMVSQRLRQFLDQGIAEEMRECELKRQDQFSESPETSQRTCWKKLEEKLAEGENWKIAHAFFDRLVVPSIACGSAVPVDPSKLVAPWCFFLEVPDEYRPLWQKMMQVAYVGEARDGRDIIPACKDEELKRPSTPFLKFVEAFLSGAENQKSAVTMLERIGFVCAPSRRNPDEQACKPDVIGFQWYERPTDFDNPDPEFLVLIGAGFVVDKGRLCALVPR